MNSQDFAFQMKRLTDVYSEKSYPRERIAQIWKIVGELDYRDFDRIVSQLILENATAPMGGKIRELADRPLALLREKRSRELQEQASLERCSKCEGHGTVSAIHRTISANPYTFRCPFCNAAEILGLAERIPLWNDKHNETFKPDFPMREGEGAPRVYLGDVRNMANAVAKRMPIERDDHM
jgi:hypothetical protein